MKLKILAIISTFLLGSLGVLAQNAQTRSLAAGQKYKIKGVVVEKYDDETFLVRDQVGVDTKVAVAPNASIRANSVFGSGERYQSRSIVRGLNVELEGVGDNSGMLSASKIRFDRSNLATAQSIDARVSPAEDRISAAEQNAQRLSGQIDELMAISNAAKGGAKAAQDTADAAVEGVNATNRRISDLDDYVVQTTATVNFKVGSAVLTPDGKAALDLIAAKAMTLKGYLIEVTGFASSDGDARTNKVLSERRAQAVKDYLIMTHNVPLRRFSTSYGYGEAQSIADNASRAGREQNRRVEIKLLVSRGINTNVEVRSGTSN
ncbi:MAG: OmpA family protein [Acidobacteria bacterium]|nr:OmpA family protein [Acidobacteriota bacterium]MCW5949993.1 OmpA family protein [Pyrinomonadaceae bacterium]